MAGIKKVHGEAFKAKVALESVHGGMNAKQLCNRFGIHPTQVNRWRKELTPGRVPFSAPARAFVAPGRPPDTTSWPTNWSRSKKLQSVD